MTTSTKLALPAWLGVALLTTACTILGVEPDVIDVADETGTGASTDNGGDGDGDGASGSESNTASDTGDPGDGDGDPGDGDGDDGETDPTSGDGDGEPGDGDGDAGADCAMYDPIALVEAANPIDIPNAMSQFEGDCGGPGPDAVFSFTATADATYQFTLASDAFEGALYLVESNCNPLEEITCELEGQPIEYVMLVGEVVYIIVDSDAAPGAATLTIAAI